jgi:hypothetical protein
MGALLRTDVSVPFLLRNAAIGIAIYFPANTFAISATAAFPRPFT